MKEYWSGCSRRFDLGPAWPFFASIMTAPGSGLFFEADLFSFVFCAEVAPVLPVAAFFVPVAVLAEPAFEVFAMRMLGLGGGLIVGKTPR